MENTKVFYYNGVSSADYGVFISGDSVYNAPARAYEMVDIPGRNGQLAIDQGRYENIEVTYPAFIYAETQSEFAEKLRNIRAWLMSTKGYLKLTDTYHPDEYRLAIYKSGLEVDPKHYNEAGEFELTFDCKPQRFLLSGETEIDPSEWGETETKSGAIVSFEAESNTGIKSLVANIEPIQSGSGDPSPSNVRPISGWSGVNINVSGINAWDEEWELGSLFGTGGNATSSTEIRSKNYIPVVGGQTYFMYCAVAATFNYRFYDEDKNFISGSYISRNNTLTIPNDARYMRFYMGAAYGTTYKNDISINYPSTDHEYHAYQGNTYPKSLGRTVYGGSLDLTSGVLTLTHKTITFTSGDGWQWNTNRGIARRWLSDIHNAGNTEDQYKILVECDRLKSGSWAGSTSFTNYDASCSAYFGDSIAIYIRGLTTLDEYKAWVTENTPTFRYLLATPQTYQLTAEQISTILGVNNIYADSGEVSVEFGADPSILVNPTAFEALPLIEVTGQGSLFVDGEEIVISDNDTKYIDSEMMEIYAIEDGEIVSKNDKVALDDFPILGKETRITSSGLSAVKVTPRWWTL